MENLIIEKTAKTPYINYNSENGIFSMVGRSIPENPESFYNKIFMWLNEYFNNPQEITNLEIQLEYINSGSSRFVLELLQLMQSNQHNTKCTINWFYEEDDEAILELGKHFQSLLDLSFKLIETY
ncbi:MAG: DUF1987 domain-containing protein [Bacteroidales bacterium]|jgi:hypothetical protein|nr:DUF1987 domain-containing protein [Bacteroidales bacterium]